MCTSACCFVERWSWTGEKLMNKNFWPRHTVVAFFSCEVKTFVIGVHFKTQLHLMFSAWVDPNDPSNAEACIGNPKMIEIREMSLLRMWNNFDWGHLNEVTKNRFTDRSWLWYLLDWCLPGWKSNEKAVQTQRAKGIFHSFDVIRSHQRPVLHQQSWGANYSGSPPIPSESHTRGWMKWNHLVSTPYSTSDQGKAGH